MTEKVDLMIWGATTCISLVGADHRCIGPIGADHIALGSSTRIIVLAHDGIGPGMTIMHRKLVSTSGTVWLQPTH